VGGCRCQALRGGRKGNFETEAALAKEDQVQRELGANSKVTLSPEEAAEVFGPSERWDALSDAQRKECLETAACLAPSDSKPERK
jgi:hypothetical protein